jgi:hypothetical protein
LLEQKQNNSYIATLPIRPLRIGVTCPESAAAFGGAKDEVVFRIEAGVQEGAPIIDPRPRGRRVDDRIGGQPEMPAGARPAPILGPCRQAGPYRVELHVADARVEMCLVEREGGEAALPQMPAPALTLVHFPRVAPVRRPERGPQPVRMRRHQDEVDMVRR